MLKRLWKRFECLIHGHDVELHEHNVWFTPERCYKLSVFVCKHCGKVVKEYNEGR